MNKLVIAMLVYNQPKITKDSIDSIIRYTTGSYLLILGDNGSDTETSNLLKSYQCDNIKYVRNENIGFIKGHNKIFSSFPSRYYCCINNDVIIKEEGWNKKLLEELNEEVVQVGPVSKYCYIGKDGIGTIRPKGKYLDYIEGFCFIVKSKIIKESLDGYLFDEKHMTFAYCEDADLSLRLRCLGYKIKEVTVDVRHLHNKTFGTEPPLKKLINRRNEESNRSILLSRWSKYLAVRNFNSPISINIISDTEQCKEYIEDLKYMYPHSSITTSATDIANNKFDKVIDLREVIIPPELENEDKTDTSKSEVIYSGINNNNRTPINFVNFVEQEVRVSKLCKFDTITLLFGTFARNIQVLNIDIQIYNSFGNILNDKYTLKDVKDITYHKIHLDKAVSIDSNFTIRVIKKFPSKIALFKNSSRIGRFGVDSNIINDYSLHMEVS